MRVIEKAMNNAIQYQQDWRLDNTKVINEGEITKVFLHDNLISEVTDTSVTLYDGGWQTNTTKSRLNAILAAHGRGDERIFQKKGQWFLSTKDGTVPFFSGVKLS
jgi:hypothetical protein